MPHPAPPGLSRATGAALFARALRQERFPTSATRHRRLPDRHARLATGRRRTRSRTSATRHRPSAPARAR